MRDLAPTLVASCGVDVSPRYAVLRGWASPIAWERLALTDTPEAALPESFPNSNRYTGCFDDPCQCMTCSTRSHRGRASATRKPSIVSSSIARSLLSYSIPLPLRRLKLAVRQAGAVPGGLDRRIGHLHRPGPAGAEMLPVSGRHSPGVMPGGNRARQAQVEGKVRESGVNLTPTAVQPSSASELLPGSSTAELPAASGEALLLGRRARRRRRKRGGHRDDLERVLPPLV